MRVQNNTGNTITYLMLSYNIAYQNNSSGDISNSLDFSYSSDGIFATPLPLDELDFATPGANDALGWQVAARTTTISGLSIANGEFFLLTWSSDIESGSGSSDEFGIDDIVINASDEAVDLIISEIMYNPSSLDQSWEWIEGYNNGNETVNLRGFALDDLVGAFLSSANITSGTIDPGNSAILYDGDDLTASQFEAAWGSGLNLIAVTNWSALNNTGDQIGIWNFLDYDNRNFSQALEQVTFDGSAPFPVDDGNGSIYLTDLSLDNNLGGSWALSTLSVSTPMGTGLSSTATASNGDNVMKWFSTGPPLRK